MDSDGAVRRIRKQIVHKQRMDGRQFHRSTFGLVLAYAITGHKAQGATLAGLTIVYITGAFVLAFCMSCCPA